MLLDTSRWLLRGVAHSSEQCCLVCPKLQLLARIGSAVTNAVCAKDLRISSSTLGPYFAQLCFTVLQLWSRGCHTSIPQHQHSGMSAGLPSMRPSESKRSFPAPSHFQGAVRLRLDSCGFPPHRVPTWQGIVSCQLFIARGLDCLSCFSQSLPSLSQSHWSFGSAETEKQASSEQSLDFSPESYQPGRLILSEPGSQRQQAARGRGECWWRW